MPKTKSAKTKRAAKTKRYQIRCTPADLARWEAFAISLGFGGASAWLCRIANKAIDDAHGSPTPSRS